MSPPAHEHRTRRFDCTPTPDIRLLESALQALEIAGTRPWLDQGTLLGLVREHQLLPQDPDLDLGLWLHEWRARRHALARSVRSKGLELLVETHMVTIVSPRQPHTRPVNIALYRPEGERALKSFRRRRRDTRSRLIRSGIGMLTGGFLIEALIRGARLLRSTDVLRLRAYGDRVSGWARLLSCKRHKVLRGLGLAQLREWATMDFSPVLSPLHHFIELEPATVNTTRAWLPSQPEQYLAFKYGADWRVPRYDWNYWTDDGGVRHASSP